MYDLIIIGSGPAGLTAAIYASRALLKTLVLSGEKWGGQLTLTTEVENYPGFPKAILGPELMRLVRAQAEKFGAKVVEEKVIKVDFKKRPFKVFANSSFKAKSVIIATGASARLLGVPNEKNLIGKGVSTCAPCDAFFFKNKNVIVVGGGDSAMEEALVLTKFAKKVTIVHRKNSFRASRFMQDKVLKNPKVKVLWNSQVLEILGKDRVKGIKLSSKLKIWEMPIDGVFIAIGHKPNTQIFKGQIELDEKGYIKKNQMMTSKEGVFTAGDVHDFHYKQAVTAAGYGCMAALEAQRWLEKEENG